MDSSIINIGRVPKYVGEFIEGNEYKKYNVCSLYGSAFINLDDRNSSIPVNIERDSSGYLTGYTVNAGWDFVSNSLDCSVECSNVIKECIDANMGSIYDVTKNNNGITFSSLQELLNSSDLSSLIPVKYRTGGMNIRFALTSDNKYVQYRYMGTETTGNPNPFLDEVNWQIIDSTRVFERTEVEMSISPNVLNRWGNIEALTIYSFQGAQEGYVNEYMLEFTVSGDDFTLTLPDGIRWIEEPTWEDGYTYQVSIINNLAVFAGWETTINE